MIRQTRKSAIFFCGFYLLLFAFYPKWIYAQDLTCCAHASGSCKSICEKVSLVDLAANSNLKNQTVYQLQKFCSSQLVSFWDCLNATLKDISNGESWSGRYCCHLPQSENCKRACVTAISSHDLYQGCRRSDEIAFYSCLERQKDGDACCGNASSFECRQACLGIFRSELTPTNFQRQRLKEICDESSPIVGDCIKDLIQVTPVNLNKHMHCCDMTNKIKCRDSCRKVLSTKSTLQEILDGLQYGGCGPPLPQDYFWQCFLKTPETTVVSAETSQIAKYGIDSAKWHCCQKASSTTCMRMCSNTFTKFWSTLSQDFHNKCLTQKSEDSLKTCLEEVEEPCELGCDGLSFCTNFNNRPTELFRSCNSQADEAARNDVALWQNQNKLTFAGTTLFLKNITTCSPEIWKAIACTLQVKPCSRYLHTTQICKPDCMDILTRCLDWGNIPVEVSAELLCSSISPDEDDMPCISLKHFSKPSEQHYQRGSIQVFSPCKGDPCGRNEICLVNKLCNFGPYCKPYTCVPACKLGDASDYLVPHGTYVRIPSPNNPKGCLKICRCNSGVIGECQPLPCVTLTSCLFGSTQELHGSSFRMDCNSCDCFAGEVICSKKQCEKSSLIGRNTGYTTLPCNCPPHYIPVCGSDGKTYPSACLAKCALLSDSNIQQFPCGDPCKNNPCSIGYKCVPAAQVCLSLMHKPCSQFQCVNGTTNCKAMAVDPVCDMENREYPNSCFLAHSNAKYAYQGPCLQNCNSNGQVCGINGITYGSECAAFADMVSVDYQGPCLAVGLMTTTKSVRCPNVKCPKLHRQDCLGVTPPGACCPLCGGALRLLYSRKQIDRALYALQNQSTTPLTLKALLKALDRQIQIAQCTLRGYLTVELDIFVTVQSTERSPSELQMETCVREAEKLASLINIKSSKMASELSLSSLTSAEIVHTYSTSGGEMFHFTNLLYVSLLLYVVF